MRTFYRMFTLTAVILLFYTGQVFGFKDGEITKTFRDIREVRIKTVSGDCVVKKGSAGEVKVELTYTYDDYDFEPELEQNGDRLRLTERFSGRTNRGRSTWRLTVPDNIRIDFSTASGNLEARDLKCFIEAQTASGHIFLTNMNGEFKCRTASGEIEAKNLQGEMEFGTASGDVELSGFSGAIEIGSASGRIKAENVKGEIELGTASGRILLSHAAGEFDVDTASGAIDAREIEVNARSEFSAASGDVEVSLARSLDHDLKLSSASGDAVLKFNKNPIKGLIKMTAKVRRGRIRAPFKFDDENYYYKWDDEYVTKTVAKGSDSPRIEISTASGTAELRED